MSISVELFATSAFNLPTYLGRSLLALLKRERDPHSLGTLLPSQTALQVTTSCRSSSGVDENFNGQTLKPRALRAGLSNFITRLVFGHLVTLKSP